MRARSSCIVFTSSLSSAYTARVAGVARSGQLAQLDHRADQRVDFDRATRFHVLQRRGLVLADFRRAFDALFQRHAKGDAELFGDRLRLAHHVGGKLARRRLLADVDQRRVGERADRIEAHVAPQLEPDFRADVVEHRRFQPRADERLRHALDALAFGAVQLADRESGRLRAA